MAEILINNPVAIEIINDAFNDIIKKIFRDRPLCFLTPKEENELKLRVYDVYKSGLRIGKNNLVYKFVQWLEDL